MTDIVYSRIGEIVKDLPVTAPPVTQCFNDVLGVVNGNIEGDNIKDGSIGTAELEDDSVTAAKIGPGACDTTALGDGSVTNDKVSATADIALTKIDIDSLSGDVTSTSAGVVSLVPASAFTAPTGTTSVIGSMWGYLGTTTPSANSTLVTTSKDWTDLSVDNAGVGTVPTGVVLALIYYRLTATASASSIFLYFQPKGSGWATNAPYYATSYPSGEFAGFASGMAIVATNSADHAIQYKTIVTGTSSAFITILGYIGPIPS